jgi:Spy/CpxP family protein refolding chaperone
MPAIKKPTVSLLVLLSVLSVTVLATEAAQRHKWWSAGDVKTALQLTDEQSKTLETIYQTARPKLQALMQPLNLEEKALSLLIDEASAQEPDVAKQVDKVELARSALSKERLLMIYRMRQELSIDQRDQLNTWLQTDRSGRQEQTKRMRPKDPDQLPKRQQPFTSGRRGDQRRR